MEQKERVLLIVDFQFNWYEIFKNCTLETGEKIKVEQTR